MSERLTDAELDRLEELHATATPGPWTPSEFGNANEIDGAGCSAVLEGGPVECISHCYGGSSVVEFSDRDHAVTIAAHNALPALIAEVREHRAREAAHRATLDTLVDGGDR